MMVEATDELRERLRVVLAENGVDEAPATLHSWRCEYPERYGKCDCVAELVTDLVAVVAEARTEQREADAQIAESLASSQPMPCCVTHEIERRGGTYVAEKIAATGCGYR